tara:strand:+ start:213 stop:950 length:738 start_codon:yes stop_codon:yes gene_type:complete
MYVYNANEIFEYLKKKGCSSTCSLLNPKDGALSFVKNANYLNFLLKIKNNIYIIAPNGICLDNIPSNIDVILTNEDINYVFAEFHNLVNKNKAPKRNKVGKNCEIHETVIMDLDGQRVIKRPNGSNIRLKHMGNVVIGNEVRIDAMTTIHRASFDSTIIKDDSTICTHVNIGHNCIIGKNTFIGPGSKIAGSTTIGDNCYIWQGCMIKNGINICDNVVIGMGSVVTRDIKYPGIYFGAPCKVQKR